LLSDAGGGGSVGRIEIVSLDGTWMQGSASLVSAATTTEQLVVK
jgi:hypothetical protein